MKLALTLVGVIAAICVAQIHASGEAAASGEGGAAVPPGGAASGEGGGGLLGGGGGGLLSGVLGLVTGLLHGLLGSLNLGGILGGGGGGGGGGGTIDIQGLLSNGGLAAILKNVLPTVAGLVPTLTNTALGATLPAVLNNVLPRITDLFRQYQMQTGNTQWQLPPQVTVLGGGGGLNLNNLVGGITGLLPQLTPLLQSILQAPQTVSQVVPTTQVIAPQLPVQPTGFARIIRLPDGFSKTLQQYYASRYGSDYGARYGAGYGTGYGTGYRYWNRNLPSWLSRIFPGKYNINDASTLDSSDLSNSSM